MRNAEIVEAAVYFPEISQNPDIPSSMHTRHRAGIGVTENSGCVSIIVSEETGQITVAVDGAWTQNVDADHLRRLLSDLLTGEARPHILARMGSAFNTRKNRTERKETTTAEEKRAV